MRSPSLPNRTGGSPASGFPVGRPRWTGANHLPTASDRALARRVFAAPTRSALRHYVGPREMAVARPLALPSCVPSLHGHYPLLRYYERSDPGRTLCRPLPWFPDSPHQNFPPFCLQSSAVLNQTRSTALNAGRSISFGLHPCLTGSPKPPTESSSLCPPQGDGRCYGLVVHFQLLSTRGCRPDAVTFSYWPYSAGQVRDLHPAVPVRSQAHQATPLGLNCKRLMEPLNGLDLVYEGHSSGR
jgi:hypothetical protein